MAYSLDIEKKITKAVGGMMGITPKKMFGGVCYLVRGNMFCGIYKDFLILRLGGDDAAKLLKEKGVRPFDITGKPMKGWVMAGSEAGLTPGKVKKWVGLAHDFAASLPAKKK
jgi:TfoX/Sxy family transcriptional regulator of competence genes